VFEFFKDGVWHTLRDVQETFNIDYAAVDEIISFLAEYRLLRLSGDRSQAIIDDEVLQILESERRNDDSVLGIARRLKRKSSD